tara:strand:- start:1323 stop:1787 length:465 start_codon:yes stop_codon:yes gene_type:complete
MDMRHLLRDDVSYIFQCCYDIVPEIVDCDIITLNPNHKRRRLAAKYKITEAAISCIALGKSHKEVIRTLVDKLKNKEEKKIVLKNLNRPRAQRIKTEIEPTIIEEKEVADNFEMCRKERSEVFAFIKEDDKMTLSMEDRNLHVTSHEIDFFYEM